MYPKTRTPPRESQIKSWELAKDHSGFYYALDMGTGKTKAAIDYCNGVEAKFVLVLCPKSVIPSWREQFEIHSHTNYDIFDQTNGSAKVKAKKIQDLVALNRIKRQHTVIVLNYEAFWRAPLGAIVDNRNRIINPGVLGSIQWSVFILDEAHRIKSPGGAASKGAHRISKNSIRKLLLSGTPMPHDPTDIYAQFRVLDPTIYPKTFSQFKQRYLIEIECQLKDSERTFKKPIGYKNMDELNAKFYSRAYRVLRHDVLDLPPVVHIDRFCDLESKARKIYNKLESDLIAEVDENKITAANALVKILRLMQMAGGWIKYDNGTEEAIDNSKIEIAQDILQDLDKDEPVIIFCNFTSEIQRIKKLCSHKDINRSAGELSGQHNNLKDWQDGKLNTLIVQIASGGEGIDLTRSAYVIYFSIGNKLGKYEQSIARTDRQGQLRSTIYYHLYANDTVDLSIQEALAKQKDIIEVALSTRLTKHKKAA